MYRTNDPRFRRRLNEIGQTLENANETAQSSLYIFGQTYIKPCFSSITSCVTSCVDASCPSLNLSQHQRERLRRQRGRSTRGRAELNFDFYDDWDDDNESDALLGWGNDEFDRVVAGGGGTYGSTITHSQPSRQKGSMSYPRGRRKSTGLLPHDGDPTVISSGSGGSFFGKLFGGKALKYKPSAAGLQEHPGAASRRHGRGGDLHHQTEGEALLEDHEYRNHRRSGLRGRSGTAMSAETSDSYSSRGDIFPSDDEHDAVPLDDEFAMVLERRISQNDAISGNSGDSGNSMSMSGGGGGSMAMDRRGKRPSAGSRQSTHRTFSSRSSHSVKRHRSQQQQPGSEQQSPAAEDGPALEDSVPSIKELKHEEGGVIGDDGEEGGEEGQTTTAMEQTSSALQSSIIEELSSKEASPRSTAPPPTSTVEDLSLPPSLLPPDDGEQHSRKPSGTPEDESKA